MKSNDIKRVVDEGLADVKMSEQSMDAVMRRVREAEHVPAPRVRKVPVVVVAVLVLLLIGTVAVAAMTLLGVFERSFEIQREEGAVLIRDWSMEHKMELIELLASVGEDLDAEKMELLYSDTLSEEEKGELAIEILEECYDLKGGYIETLDILMREKGPIEYWTHEERAWFSEQIGVTFEYIGDMRFLVPTDRDLSEEDAYAIAYKYYEETLGLGPEYFDTTQQYASFAEVLNEDLTITKQWRLTLILNIDQYDGTELIDNSLTIDISNEGIVTYAGELAFRTWMDDWYDTLMAADFWTIEGLCAFKTGYEKSRGNQSEMTAGT